MSYLTGQIRKQVVLIQTCCYNIDQTARQEHAKVLAGSDPASDGNVTRLDQLGNIGKLLELVRKRCEEMETCLEVAEDMEKEAKDEVQETKQLL